MNRLSILGTALAGTLLATSSLAGGGGGCPPPTNYCDPGCYQLGNKVTGQVALPDYGLRLDGLFGNPSDHYTFGFELPNTGVEMCYDGAGTITIEGMAFGGLDIGSSWDPNVQSFIDIHFVFKNAACDNNDLLVKESNGGYGYGTVTWLATGETFYLEGKANGSGDIFLFDGSNGQDARGWVTWGNGLVGDFSMTTQANGDCPPGPDCDGDGIDDSLESDCNSNGIPDDCEPLADCDGNGVADVCDLAGGANDQDQNGVLDVCEPGIDIYCVPDGQSGTTIDCPCGNNVVPGALEGCVNSNGVGASLSTTGTPSVAAADLSLNVAGLPGAPPGVFFSGNMASAGGQGTPFLSGIRCVGGSVVRLAKIPTTPSGLATLPGQNFPPLFQMVGAMPGDTTYFQFWYRDPAGPCGASANMTNGVRVIWGL